MIASENFSSLATQCAMANLLTDKYAEGIPHHRFYAGCDNVDSIEDLANQRARELFGAAHAYAQPHSGADANLVAFWAVLRARVELPAMVESRRRGKRREASRRLTGTSFRSSSGAPSASALGNQRLLGMDLASGGHLTHGYRLNSSGKMFEAHGYTVDRSTFLLDYDAIERQALDVKPLILLAGFSAYPRNINYARMRAIADKVGAVFMVDMAHFAGLVAGKVLTGDFDPIPHAHIVTTTTHKTLRGPRGGLVLCNEEFKDHVDRGCPLVLGGPLPHVMAAKAVAFTEALRPEFSDLCSPHRGQRPGAGRSVRGPGAESAHRRDRQPPAGGRRRLDPRDHRPPGRRRHSQAAESRSTATRSRSTPTAPGTPAACASAPRPSPRWAWARAEMNEIASRRRLGAQERETRRPPDRVPSTRPSTPWTNRFAPRPTPASSDLLESYPLYPEIDLPFLAGYFGPEAAYEGAS